MGVQSPFKGVCVDRWGCIHLLKVCVGVWGAVTLLLGDLCGLPEVPNTQLCAAAGPDYLWKSQVSAQEVPYRCAYRRCHICVIIGGAR